MLSPGDQPHHAALTLDEIKAAVEEAGTQGRKVMAHAQANAGIKNALKAGVSTIEHGIWLDGDAIEMMLDGHNALVPTLIAPHWVIRHAEAGKMPAYAIAKAKAVIGDHQASIKMAIESGVKIAFGTDMGVGPHGLNGEEFLLMRQLGMEPIDCIRSATTVAAETIGMNGVGKLEPGSWGDVIGVPGTPEMIGANATAIATAEDREQFKVAMQEIGLSVPATMACSASMPSQAPALLGNIAAQATMSTWGSFATTSQTPAACLRPIGMPRSSGFLGAIPSCMKGSRAALVSGAKSGIVAPSVSA